MIIGFGFRVIPMYVCLFFSTLSVAAALLEDLIGYEEIQQPILMGLVGMLKATEDRPPGTVPSASSVPNPLLGGCTLSDAVKFSA